MMNEKLKSKIISAPAGSGKTERLARRYIELLQYVEPERILTITFTDKAAAEMKERIFKILKESDLKAYNQLKEKSLQLRIQTIDSFCFSLLRRFFHLIDYQPDLEVLTDATYLKELSMSNTLLTIAEQGTKDHDYTTLIDLITTNKFKGWKTLQQLFNALYSARLSPHRAKLPPIDGFENLSQLITDLEKDPITQERIPYFQFRIPQTHEEAEQLKAEIAKIESVFLTKGKTPKIQSETPRQREWNCKMAEYRRIIFNLTSNFRFQSTFQLFTNRFLKEFEQLKKSLNQVDFADLEILTYQILTTHPEWSNILYLFDEHTDHILVDEFQDTSFLQWAIISKLVEEWLSGEGAKRTRGIKPTIFLVGDDKQSIYLFRNAHPEIFERAKQHLANRLTKDEFEYEKVKENYRSLQSIIDFTNHIFSKLMAPQADEPAWMTRYKEFERKRNNANPGLVEIILSPLKANMPEARTQDAEVVAKKILSIIGKPIVYDKDENPRPARYEDITILLRSRTHLAHYENALRKYQIPFIVVKGIGFYDTLEITLLRAILNFLVSPSDDFSLYLILKSPLFNLTEKEIFMISQTNLTNDLSSLWQRLIKYSIQHPQYQKTVEILNDYLKQVYLKPLSEIIEDILDSREGWQYFYEPQRTVNIKKFLRIVEQLEDDGTHPLLIADYFEKNLRKDEPKANINTEGRNEVKIMTVHAAKGLQFPIVFVIGLDQNLTHKVNQENASLVINEHDEDTVYVLYEPDTELRKQSEIFQEKIDKEYEEEKRIFYVAVTRARDALYLTGVDNPGSRQKDSQVQWLKDYLPIIYDEQKQIYYTPTKINGLSIITDKELGPATIATPPILEEISEKKLCIEPIIEQSEYIWQAVTKETEEIYRQIRYRHGDDYIILGEILHKIFEKISQAELKFQLPDIIKETQRLCLINNCHQETCKIILEQIEQQFTILMNTDIKKIMLPQKNSYAELPFILKHERTIYSGRIDRIIIQDNTINIYDYKTFPLKKSDIPDLKEIYANQMTIYQQAVSELFPNHTIKTYLVFTAIAELISLP